MSNARDNGYKIARKDTWIAFLDADDIFHPNMFQDMMEYKNSFYGSGDASEKIVCEMERRFKIGR